MSSTSCLYLGDECHILEEILFSSQKKIREKYKSLFDFSLDLIYVHDLKGNFLDANDIALKTFGYTKEEISELSFKDLMDKDQARIAFNMIDQTIEKGEQTKLIEFKLKTKEGNSIYFKSSGIPLKENGKVYAVLCIAKDITEHKKVEQKLNESLEKYQLIAENTTDMVEIINTNHELEYINEQVHMKKLGYLKEDLIGKSPILFIHPDDHVKIVKDLSGDIEVGAGPTSLRVKKKNGKYVWLEIKGRIFSDREGKKKGLLILRDISERKQIDNALKENKQRLTGIIASITHHMSMIDEHHNIV